jgi:hypothetical protein
LKIHLMLGGRGSPEAWSGKSPMDAARESSYATDVADRVPPSTASIFARLSLFLALGGLATFFLWPNLSHLLYGRAREVSVPGLLGGAVALGAVLWGLGRWIRRLPT